MNTQQIIGIIIAVVVVIAFIIYIAWQIKKKGLRQFAIDMILQAEEEFAQGQNKEKMEHVIIAIKTMLSTNIIGKVLCAVITDENIENFIQSVFDSIKKALDYVPKKEV